MDADLDTLATALYVRVDDALKNDPSLAPLRPVVGIAPKVSDAELVTVAVTVTGAPKVDGLLLDATLVVVASPMVSVADVVWVRLPLVPVIVRGKLPRGVPAAEVTVIVDDPDDEMDGGRKVAVAPCGRPLTLKVTVPAKPPAAATLTV